jgi:hypothetical protein
MRPSLSLPRSRPRRLTVEIVVLAVIFAFGGFAAPTLAAQIQKVLVVNTSSNPVPVAGTVRIGNFPATQRVNVIGGTISAAQQVSTVIAGTEFHAVAFAAGDELDFGASGLNVTAIAVNDGRSEQDSWRVNIFGVPSGAIKIASGSGNYFVALPQPILASAIEVQCLSSGGCFWSIQAAGYPTE